jgi:WD40 repeat protein
MAATRRAFISYARKDGAALARRLQKSLAAKGVDAWLDTKRISGGNSWTVDIENALDAANCVLALLTSGSYISEICRAEQLRALRKRRRVIPVLAERGCDIPLYLEAKNYRDFSDPAKYAARFRDLLGDIRGRAGVTVSQSYQTTPVTYLTAPPRVTNYVDRPDAVRALRDAIFADDQRQPIALTALSGMGGIGKTVLAKALTEDEVVRQAFPDGIVWITAGKERQRDFAADFREVARALGADVTRCDTAPACQSRYRTTIADKAALIVLDDVWSKADIEPLLAESKRSRFLFTTRDASIGNFVGAREHRADLLDEARARELFAAWAGRPIAQLPPQTDALIAECGRLPLALSVVGAMLRGKAPAFWTDTLDLLRRADLSAIQARLPDGQDSFFKAVEVSFQSLSRPMQERYKALAVLIEDVPTPLPILEILWGVDEAEARSASQHFVDRSLALRDGDEAVRLHDLQLDYVRAQFQQKDALDLIHGAMRLSAHVIGRDPDQFVSQMTGRLAGYRDVKPVERFTEQLANGARTAWLRAQQATLHPPGTALVRTLVGHSDDVTAVALSRDAQRAVSGSEDETLKVWDISRGRELHTLTGHTDYIGAVALSDDGRIAISASDDKTVKVWDAESGRERRTLKGHSGFVRGLVMSGNGRIAISASADELKVWDVEKGRALRTVKDRETGTAVALSGDGHVAVTTADDDTLQVWDVQKWRKLRTLKGHYHSVKRVVLAWGGRVAAAACRTDSKDWDDSVYELKTWDVATGRERHSMPTEMEHHSGWVDYLAISHDGRIVGAPIGKVVRLWETETGRELRSLRGHADDVDSVALSEDGRVAVSGSKDKTVRVWRVGGGRDLDLPQGHSGAVNALAVSRDGAIAITASDDGTLKIWDVATGRDVRTLECRWRNVRLVALSANGRIAVCFSRHSSDEASVEVWDVQSGDRLPGFKHRFYDVSGLALDGEGRILGVSHGVNASVFDLTTGKQVLYGGHSVMATTSVALDRDGRTMISASLDGTFKVWDVASRRSVRTVKTRGQRLQRVALSGDGRVAISATRKYSRDDESRVTVWDTATWRTLHERLGQLEPVCDVALNETGQLAVSAYEDGTVRLWETATAAPLATFTCDGPARCCTFVDDERIVAGDDGGRVHFLHVEIPKHVQS